MRGLLPSTSTVLCKANVKYHSRFWHCALLHQLLRFSPSMGVVDRRSLFQLLLHTLPSTRPIPDSTHHRRSYEVIGSCCYLRYRPACDYAHTIMHTSVRRIPTLCKSHGIFQGIFLPDRGTTALCSQLNVPGRSQASQYRRADCGNSQLPKPSINQFSPPSWA